MKKTSIFLALALAAVSAFFVSCSTEGSAPSITGAYFSSHVENGADYDTIKRDYELHELNLSSTEINYLVIKMDDPDCDVMDLRFSTDRSFADYLHWETQPSNYPVCAWYNINWSIVNINHSDWVQNNGSIYVMAVDSEGHESNIYTIPGITITE